MLPQASGTAIARTPRITGAFHGAMPSTTPAACRTPIARLPGTSDGITSPLIWVVSDAASRSVPAARCTLKPAHSAEPPVSAAMAAANASPLASSACAAFIRSARRSPGPVADHAGKALAAASTAVTTSATVAAGARVATLPSSGLRRSNVALSRACVCSPLISIEIVFIFVLSVRGGVWNEGMVVRRPGFRRASVSASAAHRAGHRAACRLR